MHIIDKTNNNQRRPPNITREENSFITFKGPKSKKQIIDYFSLL